jgi:hypothetical protein
LQNKTSGLGGDRNCATSDCPPFQAIRRNALKNVGNGNRVLNGHSSHEFSLFMTRFVERCQWFRPTLQLGKHFFPTKAGTTEV